MSLLHDQYKELLAYTQLALLENYAPKEWIFSEADTFAYFKAQAKSEKTKPPASAPIPTKVSTPPAPKPQEPVKEPAKQVEPAPNKIKLEPLSAPVAPEMGALKKIIQEQNPEQEILPCPTDLRQSIQMEILLVADAETPAERRFLYNVAKAITMLGCPTAVIAKTTLTPPSAKAYLGQEKHRSLFPQLLFLSILEPSVYMKEPHRKADLWQAIRHELVRKLR